MNNYNKIIIGDIEFTAFEAGEFRMGALGGDKYANILEKNRNTKIEDFYLQSTPVTVGQYFSFLKDTGYDSNYQIEIWDGDDWVKGPHFLVIYGFFQAEAGIRDWSVTGVQTCALLI